MERVPQLRRCSPTLNTDQRLPHIGLVGDTYTIPLYGDDIQTADVPPVFQVPAAPHL
jgi:hypothetical protein